METMPLLPLNPTDNYEGRKVEQLLAPVDAVQPAIITLNCSKATNYNFDILLNTMMCCR